MTIQSNEIFVNAKRLSHEDYSVDRKYYPTIQRENPDNSLKYLLKPIDEMDCMYEVVESEQSIWIDGVKYQLTPCQGQVNCYRVYFLGYETREGIEHVKVAEAEWRSDEDLDRHNWSRNMVFENFADRLSFPELEIFYIPLCMNSEKIRDAQRRLLSLIKTEDFEAK